MKYEVRFYAEYYWKTKVEANSPEEAEVKARADYEKVGEREMEYLYDKDVEVYKTDEA